MALPAVVASQEFVLTFHHATRSKGVLWPQPQLALSRLGVMMSSIQRVPLLGNELLLFSSHIDTECNSKLSTDHYYCSFIPNPSACPCSPGTVHASDPSVCIPCGAGLHPVNDVCVDCPLGTFNNVTNSGVCVPCADGTIGSSLGQTIPCSTVCGAGSFADAVHISCVPCSAGTASASPGSQGSCPLCP